MKFFPLIFFITVSNAYAESAVESINKTCLKHAISVVDQLQSELSPRLEKEQLNHILRITTENCKKQFAQMPENNETKSVVRAEESEDSGDWFTEKILKGDSTRKEGNRRLRKMQHK